jgi:protein-S-isoprenylcysteine O-methyltransferase Ste14
MTEGGDLMYMVCIILFFVSVFLFFGMEIYLGSKQKKDLDDSLDSESLKRITLFRNISFATAIATTFFPIMSIPGSRSAHLLAGAIFILTGTIIRTWAILTLGQYFTSVVSTQPDQKLITSGPYKFIRHPGYSGGLLFYIGIGTATGSIPGLAVIIALLFYGIDQRIKVEEPVMISLLGEEYIEYMKRTGKLIPFLY